MAAEGRSELKPWPMRQGDERSDYAPLERSGKGVGYVYFLGSPDGARVKVGWSGDEKSLKRLKQHASGDAFGRGGDYTVLALVRGSKVAEGKIHTFFADHLVDGPKSEVFHAAPMIPYITWLRDNYFVSTTIEEFQSVSGQAVIDFNAWMPGHGRVSSRQSQNSLLIACDPWSVLPSRVLTGDDYYTPPEYIDRVRKALGGVIDLDPASHVYANEVVKARQFFTKDQNGLIHPWRGDVYLNPPFSSWPDWVPKVLEEVASGRISQIVALGATRTLSAQYFKPLLRRADAFCIISGRTAFWGISTDSDSPTDGHFLLYIGDRAERFSASVEDLGAVWVSPRIQVA